MFIPGQNNYGWTGFSNGVLAGKRTESETDIYQLLLQELWLLISKIQL